MSIARLARVVLVAAGLAAWGAPLRADTSTPFAPAHAPERPRSDIGAPLLSFVVPGLDQWLEGQYGAAAAYTGVAAAGYGYADHIAREDGLWEKDRRRRVAKRRGEAVGEDEGLAQKGIAERKFTLGVLAAQGAGGLSAYHSFRTAVHTRQPHGEYAFLDRGDTPLELLAAPFRFHYLARPSTFIPLAIIGALSAYQLSADLPPDAKVERTAFTRADAAFAGAYSYNAGTHEEALFRGWIMPVMREAWGSDFWSNAAQSVLFALAHLSSNPQPLPQLLLGFHLGNVTQDEGWRLGEAVFIHVWWDVLAFTAQYHYKQRDPDASKSSFRPVLWLPPLQLAF